MWIELLYYERGELITWDIEGKNEEQLLYNISFCLNLLSNLVGMKQNTKQIRNEDKE